MLQSEFFPDLPPDQKPKRFPFANFPGSFLHLRVAYEDAVFTLLGLVLVVLAGFCLGVERGKQLGPQLQLVSAAGVATARESVTIPEAVRVEVPALARPRRPIPVIPAAAPVAPRPAPAGGGFAIQLATYAGPETAQQEVRRLAKQGVRAQVLKQGRYLELRAVGYRSKQEAKSALAGLRKMYPDAFLKRVSNS